MGKNGKFWSGDLWKWLCGDSFLLIISYNIIDFGGKLI